MPDEFGQSGQALWDNVCATYGLREDERVALRQACRLLDIADELQAAVDRDGVTVHGSAGQIRAHPALTELRASRESAARLLRSLRLPDPTADVGGTSTSDKARRAARARWDRSAGRPGGGRRGNTGSA